MKIINSIKRVFRIVFRNIIVENNKVEQFNTNCTLMSFNIRADLPKDIEHNWNNRKEAILRMIADVKPAIICMQEVMPHMYKYLKNNLSNIYDCTDLNVHWFNSGKVIFYDKKYYKLNNYKEIYLPTNNEDKENRTILDTTFVNKKTNKYLKIYNIHLSAYSKQLRGYSMSILNDELSKFPLNSYACGDFNCNSDSSEFKFLSKYNITPNKGRTFNHFDRTCSYLDYIVTNRFIKNYKVINENYGVPYISDHYPIVIDF